MHIVRLSHTRPETQLDTDRPDAATHIAVAVGVGIVIIQTRLCSAG